MSLIQNGHASNTTKLLNLDTAKQLEEKLVDYSHVKLKNNTVYAWEDDTVLVIQVHSPIRSLELCLERKIDDVAVVNDQLLVLTTGKQLWRISAEEQGLRKELLYELPQSNSSETIATFTPWRTSLVICTVDTFRKTWVLSVADDKRVTTVCSFDICQHNTGNRITEKPRLLYCPQPKPPGGKLSRPAPRDPLYLGTPEGHLYEVDLLSKSYLLLCDLQQAVVSLQHSNNHLLVAGSRGKLALVDLKQKNIWLDFIKNPVLETAFSDKLLVYQNHNGLFTAVVDNPDSEGFLRQSQRLGVVSPRAFSCNFLSSTVDCLTEDGLVCRIPLQGDSTAEKSPEPGNTKTLLQEIHSAADAVKAANMKGSNIRRKLQQLSAALFLFNKINERDHFCTKIATFANSSVDVTSQTLHIHLENRTNYELEPPFWTLQTSVSFNGAESVSFSTSLTKPWTNSTSQDLLYKLSLKPSVLTYDIQISLIFSISEDDALEPLCAIPIHRASLGILEFLEPSVPVDFSPVTMETGDLTAFLDNLAKSKPYYSFFNQGEPEQSSDPYSGTIGISRKMFSSQFEILRVVLENSWSRGFDKFLNESCESTEIYASFCGRSIRFLLRQVEEPAVHVLRVESFEKSVIEPLLQQMTSRLESRSKEQTTFAVSRHVISNVEGLLRRLRYVTALDNCADVDLKPIVEEFHKMRAIHFPVQ